jgi:hypothetical protein
LQSLVFDDGEVSVSASTVESSSKPFAAVTLETVCVIGVFLEISFPVEFDFDTALSTLVSVDDGANNSDLFVL